MQSLRVFLVAAFALVAALVAVAAGWVAMRQNAFALEAQRAVARQETESAFLELVGRLSTEANWQVAYDNVVRRWNVAWIEREYGSTLKTLGVANVAIFGPRGEILWSIAEMREARTSKAAVANAAGMRELLAVVQSTWPQTVQLQKQGIVVIAGIPCFAVATAITPDEAADADPSPARRYTLVYFAPVTAGQYRSLSAVLEASKMSVVTAGRTTPGFAAIALKDAAGGVRASLEWQPYRPGTNVLIVLLPVLFGALLAIAFAATGATRRWQRIQRRLLGSEAKANAAAEEVRVKSVFIGNISHELRTPLNAIIGFAEMLKMHMFGPLGSSKNEEYVDYIIAGSRRLLKLVNDLIEISRIEARDTALEREVVDAAAILRAAATAMRPQAERNKVQLAEQSEAQGAWCTASSLNLHHALVRLLENAIDVTGAGESVWLFWTRSGGDVVIGISDKGEELPPEMLVRRNRKLSLFSDNHMVTHKSHLGINFNIAQGLLLLMGGGISFKSVADEGNTVFLRLPAAEAPRRTETQAEIAA